jgi:outer membrane immunogenic protein
MKKMIYLLFLIASLFITQSCSDHLFNALFWQVLTANAGIHKSTIVGQSESYYDPIGAQVGVTFPLIEFSEPMSIRAEANLSMQGSKYEDTYFGTPLKGRVNLLYLNFPLVFRYQTKSGFFGEAGIQPGFLLSAKDKYSGETHDYKDNVKKFDFSIPFGAGYEFKNNFGVGLRVIPGLTNINTEGTAKDRNLVVALRGTYTFKLKQNTNKK